jgi:hypothetical protein
MSGIVHATTPAGYALPVIDVTNPAFALAADADALDGLRSAFLDHQRREGRIPGFLRAPLLWLMARRSLLLRALLEPRAAYLGGLSTYAMKLGPTNLPPPFDGKIDRHLAALPAATSLRLRLQQTEVRSPGRRSYSGIFPTIGTMRRRWRAWSIRSVSSAPAQESSSDRSRGRTRSPGASFAKSRFTLTPRGVAGFAPLAARAGFAIARVEPALVSDQVLLTPA